MLHGPVRQLFVAAVLVVAAMLMRRVLVVFDMQCAVQQAQRLRQQQRAHQQADQRSAQRQGNEAAVHAAAAKPGSLTTAAPA